MEVQALGRQARTTEEMVTLMLRVCACGPWSAAELASVFARNAGTMQGYLDALRDQGKLCEQGGGWRLPDESP